MNINDLIDDLPVHHVNDDGVWITKATPNLRYPRPCYSLQFWEVVGYGRSFAESQKDFQEKAARFLQLDISCGFLAI